MSHATLAERKNVITFKGDPMTLAGQELKIGDAAPEATVTSNALKPIQLSSFRGKTCVIASVPSLDTPVCDVEAKRFNDEASTLGDNVAVIIISRDLPFAQARWCGASNARNIQTLSDYNSGEFGQNYGMIWKETALLARAVFVIDAEGKIQYIQLVNEITNGPNYEEILAAIKQITG